MIAPSAIQTFLDRELDDHDWLKSLVEAEVDKRLSLLYPPPNFHTKPFLHQKVCFLLGIEYAGFMFLADPGVGKTAVALNIIKYLKSLDKVKKTLVLVPNVSLIRQWSEECQIRTPNLTTTEIFGTKQQRLKLLHNSTDVFILNYAGLQAILSTTPSSSKSKKRLVLKEDIDKFASQFDCMILDEVIAVKNPKSLTFKICDRMANTIPYRYGLTGRPFGRDATDLWGQFKVTDGGMTLGQNYFLFRAAFFTPKKTPWAIEWKLNRKYQDLLHETIKHRSIRYRADECITLPPVVYSIRAVPLSEEAKTYYHPTQNKLFKAISDRSIEIIQNSFVQLREIATGHLNYKSDEGEKEQIIFLENPKLDLLEELIQEIPEDFKIIIFYEYNLSGRLISNRLSKLGINYRWIWGAVSDIKTLQYIQEFQNDPHVQVLVSNSKKGGIGLNLQIANYVFFFESPVSPMVRQQAEARVLRPGQKNKVFIVDIITENSIEERVLSFIKEGKNLLQVLIESRNENRSRTKI